MSIKRDLYRVVGFEVEPKSIDSKRIKVEADGSCSILAGQNMQEIKATGSIETDQIIFLCIYKIRTKQNYNDLSSRMDAK